MELLPLCVGAAFCLIHVVNYLRKKYFLGRSRKLYSHVPALVGTMLTMMYYLYLNLTRSILDVFDCQPTTPSDGHLYMRTLRHGLNATCCVSTVDVCAFRVDNEMHVTSIHVVSWLFRPGHVC